MNLKNLLLISFVIAMAGCNLKPLTIDPCAILPDMKSCYAVPLNNPGKANYERLLNAGDICFLSDEYARAQKSYRALMRKCGDRCK